PSGYVLFQHHRNADATRFWLQLKDFQFTTHEAGNALFKLINSFSSTSDEFLFTRGTDDPMFAYLSPKAQRIDFVFNWFQRITHVQNALESRGYNKQLSGMASLRVKDEQLKGNDLAYQVDVEEGSANVKVIDKAETEIDVDGLASLYCGRFSPAQLRQLGSLSGDDSGDEFLGLMFAGAQSSLPDFF
ncbi:MAG: sterol carrier protein domain-containing protein, partial [Planctomycetota bacterium]